MSIEIIKGECWRNIILAFVDDLKIEKDFSIYIGDDCDEYYRTITGKDIKTSAGIYCSDIKLVLIKCSRADIIFHELVHVRFNELYGKINKDEEVIDFINEYIALYYECKMIVSIISTNEEFNGVIEQFTININEIYKEIKGFSIKSIEDRIRYMRRIANLLSTRRILKEINAYSCKGFNYEIDKMLGCFKKVDELEIENVKFKYKEIEKEFKSYIKELV